MNSIHPTETRATRGVRTTMNDKMMPTFEIVTDHAAARATSPIDEFASAHGLTRLIQIGSDLAGECFDLAAPITARLVSDPETDCEWIELRACARGGVAAVHDAYHQYTQRWLGVVPAEKSTEIRLAIRLV
jgi:hypothetical protein